jgi:kynureninase
MINDPLLKWRDEFPILKETTYLVSHSLGAMPRNVYDSLRAYADIWASRGVRAWGDVWFNLNGQVGDKIGRLINAPPKSISMQESTSIAMSILLSSMEFPDKRSKVVLDDMIFTSEYYVLKAMLPPHMQMQVIKTRDSITIPADELLDAMDERTALVWVNQVLFRSAYIMPAEAIIEKAHRVGAKVVFSGYHSVGVIPVDVTALNVDFFIGGVLKWLCGGPGGVFLYVRPDHTPTLHPKITGWFAHKRPFHFEVDEIDQRDDNYRFLTGTYGVPAMYALQPGIDIITQVGVDNIRAKSKRQTALLIDLAQKAGFELKTPLNPDERGGMVVVNPPEAYAVSRELVARNLLVDFRENAGIRIAPHFYNTDDEIRQVIAAIQDILETGAWKQHAESRAFIT